MKKKIILWLMIGLFLISYSSNGRIYAATNGKTAQEAIEYVKTLVGKELDEDGYYGPQCVDLVMHYYKYLGASRPRGNGADYVDNTLPGGWSRIQGAKPQLGDILVYAGTDSNPYGHVAIFESAYSHYHIRFNNNPQVSQVDARYDDFGNYWGVIRPDFVQQHPPMTSKITNVSSTSAQLQIQILSPKLQAVGYKIGLTSTQLNAVSQVDVVNHEAAYTFSIEGLAPNTTYFVQPFYQMNAQVIEDAIISFQTAPASMWVKTDRGYKYQHADGSYSVDRWEYIDHNWYHFNEEGLMTRGWLLYKGDWYYLKSSGAMARHEVIGGKYYVNHDGKWIKYGWHFENGSWKYFDQSNQFLSDTWSEINSKKYYFDAHGKMVTGWLLYQDKWFYLKSSGEMAKNEVIGGKYYLDEQGEWIKVGWVKQGTHWKYFAADFTFVENQWLKVDKQWYWLDESGYMVTGWKKINDKWYYFKSNGHMVTGTQTINGKIYQFASSGAWIQ